MEKKNVLVYFPAIILGILLTYVLFWRWQVSTIRFFDVDEFSYMHWTAQVARGEHMYTDFFSYFTPGFMWAFAPVYWFVGRSAAVFTVGREVSFVIFLGILGALSYLWGITRGWKWALLPAVILAFLPMPYDKFLEIRPDNLATLLAVAGVIGEVRALQTKKNIWWLFSGLAYSASLFVLVKTLPIVGVGVGIAFLSAVTPWFSQSSRSRPPILHSLSGAKAVTIVRNGMPAFVMGLFGPWVLFFLGTIMTGQFGVVWYSLTRLPFEVYRSAAGAAMEADLFFFPNVSFYGLGAGLTTGLLSNHFLWILGVLVSAYRLVIPRKPFYVELLVGISFLVLVFGYVKFFPLKHSQYLIPIAVFIAYYAADGLSVFFDWLAGVGGYESLTIVLIGLAFLLGSVTREVNAPKLLVTNRNQISELTTLISTIPPDARIVDFEGRMVFWPEGYPVSSLPIASTLTFVTRRPPAIADYLSAHPAGYIWDGDSGRIGLETQPENAFIQSHYSRVAGWDGKLWKRNQ